MITICPKGRLGNVMIKNCAASILSKKFNIKVREYLQEDKMQIFRPNFYKKGMKVYGEQITVSNNFLLKLLKQKKDINLGLDLKCWCQKKQFVLKYKNEILSQFNPQYNQGHEDDLFVHVRLGDIIPLNRVASLNYYINAIEQSSFNKGFISSDTPSHEIVTHLMNKFNLTFYKNKPAETINFAKDFGNLVLSDGTFSWWIGFLSKAKSVFYPKGGPIWVGDIFAFKEWKSLPF